MRDEQLTSDRSATFGEADWGTGVGVEEGGWVRTEIIVRELWMGGEGEREGAKLI